MDHFSLLLWITSLALRPGRHSGSKRGVARTKPGDLFEIIVIQIKGGSAKWPTKSDIARLRKVARYYRARGVVLAEWKKGKRPTLFWLDTPKSADPWLEIESEDVFG